MRRGLGIIRDLGGELSILGARCVLRFWVPGLGFGLCVCVCVCVCVYSMLASCLISVSIHVLLFSNYTRCVRWSEGGPKAFGYW